MRAFEVVQANCTWPWQLKMDWTSVALSSRLLIFAALHRIITPDQRQRTRLVLSLMGLWCDNIVMQYRLERQVFWSAADVRSQRNIPVKLLHVTLSRLMQQD